MLASCLSLLIPLVLKWLVDGPVAHRDPSGVWLGGGLVLLLGTLEAALFGLRRWLAARPMAGLEARMRADLHRHLQRLPVASHDRWGSGQLLARGTNDLQIIRQFLMFPLVFLVVNSVTIVVGFALLIAQQWSLGLVLLLPAAPLVVLSSYFESRYALAARRAQDQIGDLTTLVEESVLGIRIIKAFGRHRGQARTFLHQSHLLRGTELRKARLLADLWALIIGLPDVALGAALIVGCTRVADDTLSAGTLVAFLSTALTLRWPVESLGWLLSLSNESATAADRFFEVMDSPLPAERDDAERDDAERHTDPMTVEQAAEADGIRFDGVRFRYPDAPQNSPDLLHGIDLHIRTGETMALVGATGSGKTTLTALLPRLYEATGGRLTLDGVDLRELSTAELRRGVVMVTQESFLFSGSVAENIALGDPKAKRDRIEAAAKAIGAHDFIAGLPDGYDTDVRKRGGRISAGQRQLVAFARALLADPAVLILDEATSSLDVPGERAVQQAMHTVLRGRTAVIIARRLSTVEIADRVLVMEAGRIVEDGTPDKLIGGTGRFADLHQAWRESLV